MRHPMSIRLTVFALAMALSVGGSARGQVIENRSGEANPSIVLFRSTLYGAGTGLLLGGAYSLVKSDDVSTWEALRWGVAGGAAAGFVIGLVYLFSRPQPGGAARILAAEPALPGAGMDALMQAQRRGAFGRGHGDLVLKLVTVRF